MFSFIAVKQYNLCMLVENTDAGVSKDKKKLDIDSGHHSNKQLNFVLNNEVHQSKALLKIRAKLDDKDVFQSFLSVVMCEQ